LPPAENMGARMAARHLRRSFPSLTGMFRALGELRDIRPSELAVPEAVTRIVIGQMLSRKAARGIASRVAAAGSRRHERHPWELSAAELRKCGLSRRKARTIGEFAVAYALAPERFDRWQYLDYPGLLAEVRRLWGMSDWTACMLAIFHFGNPDVWPVSDGSIVRAASLVSECLLSGQVLEADLAAPYRSYLALYLWRSLDTGFWANGQAKAAVSLRRGTGDAVDRQLAMERP